MISYNHLLNEMAHQLEKAKSSTKLQERREALAAIRSLCEVGLGSEQKVSSSPVQKVSSSSPQIGMESYAPVESRPLHEEDANGESIFDF